MRGSPEGIDLEHWMNKQFKPYPFAGKKYAARLPQLTQGVDAQRHAVTIVGGGPVGLAVALGLANH
ncbi:hypothetical protein, partial [Burkholderia sp. SIMBA_048]|uniref:hypothetical protein n=1 Tax=Burkholderia sp. SIMBA_048 TaxID=3085789 RepID=UPI00397DBBAD